MTTLRLTIPAACLSLLSLSVAQSRAAHPPQGTPVPPVFATAMSLPDLPDGDGAWVLQVVTRGGLDGRGRGDLAITSQGSVTCSSTKTPCAKNLASSALQSLVQRIGTATQSAWTGSHLGPCGDCVATLLVLRRREPGGAQRTYAAYWDVTTLGTVAADVRGLYELAIALGK